MKYIILIIILVITFLMENKYFKKLSINANDSKENKHINTSNISIKKQRNKDNIEKFIGKPYIWVYLESENTSKFWKNFYSRRSLQGLSEYINLGIKTLQIYNKEYFNIQILTESTLKLFIRNCPFIWNDNKVNNILKYQYVKYYLLYNYGGIWINPDVIVFKSLNEFYEKLNDKNIVLFNCSKENLSCENNCKPDLDIIAVKKGENIIKQVLDNLKSKIRMGHSNYNFSNLTNNLMYKLLEKNKNYIYLFGPEYNGTRDYNDKLITVENLVSNNHTLVKDPYKIMLIKTDMKNVNYLHKYKWLARLNKEQILNANMWISKLLRFALNKPQIYVHHKGIGTSKLKEEIYNINPKKYSEFQNTKKNMISMLHNPYSIVAKQSYRNT